MKIVVIYQRNKRIARSPEKMAALASLAKSALAAAGIMGGFIFSAALWAGRLGFDAWEAAGELSAVFLIAALGYGAVLHFFSAALAPRRGRVSLAGVAPLLTFFASFAFGAAGIRAALWLAA